MAKAIKTWMRVCPSVYREHSPGHPAGMGIDAWQDDSGATWVKSRISDEESAALCRSGRLKAYSIGVRDPETRKSSRCPRHEIVGGRLTELSIVSSPANLRCGVKIIGKSASGVPEFIGKAWGMAGKDEVAKAERHLQKAAKLLGWGSFSVDQPSEVFKAADPVRAAEESLRAHARAALKYSDPRYRELAEEVLRGSSS